MTSFRTLVTIHPRLTEELLLIHTSRCELLSNVAERRTHWSRHLAESFMKASSICSMVGQPTARTKAARAANPPHYVRFVLSLSREQFPRLCIAFFRAILARWTRSKLLWVHGKFSNKAEVAPRVRQPEFVSGESFSYLGRNYRLKVVHGAKESLRFDGRNFLLSGSARSQAADHFRRWYVHTGREWLRERVRLLRSRA